MWRLGKSGRKLFVGAGHFFSQAFELLDEQRRRVVADTGTEGFFAVRLFDIVARVVVDIIEFGNIRLFVDVDENWNEVGLDIFFNVRLVIGVVPHIGAEACMKFVKGK